MYNVFSYLKHNSNIRWQRQSFTIGQGEQFVVIKHRVQILNPFRVYIAVEYYPLAFVDFATHVVNDFSTGIILGFDITVL